MIKGFWSERWAPVVEVFAANFASSGEQGAGLALFHRGELVVNAWGGYYNNRLAQLTNEPWSEQTCVNIFSAGKGLVALCVLRLVAEGRLDLDKPVALYWPEFCGRKFCGREFAGKDVAGEQYADAMANKAEITVRQVLCHRSGLSAFHPQMRHEDIFNWDAMTQATAADTPWWLPNTAQGYSPFIFGFLLGELIKRVSNSASFDDYFQREIAIPLGLSCYFGVPDESLSSIADSGPLQRSLANAANQNSAVQSDGADHFALGKLMKENPRGVTHKAFANPLSLMTAANSLEWRKAQIPAANAHANAAALATVYGKLASGNELLAAPNLPLCWQEQSFEHDQVLGLPLRFSLGFMLSQHNRQDCRYGRGTRAFGHPGAGGCLGFADPDYQLGFGYVTNGMGQSLLVDERAIRIIDATYKVLEN
ncbi:MAG: serine hydrolase domain-containing protein [Pseudomonadota bacterium]